MNQQGGIISKILFIPIGIAFMAGFFFLGYNVGKYQNKSNQSEIVVPLPEIVSENLPERQEFTFFKTLSDKEHRTVSIELKPGRDGTSKEKARQQKPDKKSEHTEKIAAPAKEREVKETARKEPAIAFTNTGLRYTLQMSSYQEKESAERDVKKLKQAGFAAFVVASQIEGKGTWYRVRLGSFANRTSAEKLQKEVQAKEAITSFITLE